MHFKILKKHAIPSDTVMSDRRNPAVCLVLRAGFLKAYEDQAASTRSIAIISQAKILADQIAANDYINKQNTESITVQLNQLSNIYDGRVMLIDSAFRIVA